MPKTKKITVDNVNSKQVSTKNGQKTVHEIYDTNGQRYSCWDGDLMNQLGIQQGATVNITYRVQQNGQYTNRTVINPNRSSNRNQSSGDSQTLKGIRTIWAELQPLKQDIAAIKNAVVEQKDDTAPTSDNAPTPDNVNAQAQTASSGGIDVNDIEF